MKSGLGGREGGKKINTKFLEDIVTSSVFIVYCWASTIFCCWEGLSLDFWVFVLQRFWNFEIQTKHVQHKSVVLSSELVLLYFYKKHPKFLKKICKNGPEFLTMTKQNCLVDEKGHQFPTVSTNQNVIMVQKKYSGFYA